MFACIGSDRRKVNLINGDTPRVAQSFIVMTSCITSACWRARENVQVDKNLGWIGIHNQAGKASYTSRLFRAGSLNSKRVIEATRDSGEHSMKSLDTITHKKSWIKNNEKALRCANLPPFDRCMQSVVVGAIKIKSERKKSCTHDAIKTKFHISTLIRAMHDLNSLVVQTSETLGGKAARRPFKCLSWNSSESFSFLCNKERSPCVLNDRPFVAWLRDFMFAL